VTRPPKRYAATDENLLGYALAPAMRRLIATALDGTTITYGELKTYLETEADFSTIFPTRIGFVAGTLMEMIQRHDLSAPLLNVLVVNQQDRMPSKGAGSFMARRFDNPRLKSATYKREHPQRWKEYFDRASAEVYAQSATQWAELFQLTFGQPLRQTEVIQEREKRQAGQEDDYGAGPGKYGAGGESAYHKALRLWVRDNPGQIDRAFAGARTETEFPLDSGDRVDAVFHLANKTVVLEVKSRISNAVDLRRGVFQCIKYRAVKQAMDLRDDVSIDAILVTETDIPGDIVALLRHHGIRHRKVSLIRD
jgi:hypothetical protein